MLVQIYQYAGRVTRSVMSAELVTELEVDSIPEDQDAFAAEHGGDFIHVPEESFVGQVNG